MSWNATGRIRCGLAALVISAIGATSCSAPNPTPVNPTRRGTDTLAAVNSCAPPGWTGSSYPPGAPDYALRSPDAMIRIITPAPERARSNSSVTFITDWWTVAAHDEAAVTFADGRTGTQYRSKTVPVHVTTEFSLPSGTWQVYGTPDDPYDVVLRCLEAHLGAVRG